MPSVRAVAVDPDHRLILLNLTGADATVSAAIIELLRSKSNGVGFLPTLFGSGERAVATERTIQALGLSMPLRRLAELGCSMARTSRPTRRICSRYEGYLTSWLCQNTL